ncbi:MAG: VacJ family lipoprotein [Candidatus Electrothrix sp. YB6]
MMRKKNVVLLVSLCFCSAFGYGLLSPLSSSVYAEEEEKGREEKIELPPSDNTAYADDEEDGDAEEIDFLDDAFYDEEAGPEVYAVDDPFEEINRAVFTFNDYAFTWVMNPLATGYSEVVPSDIRGAVGNFFHNLQEPMRLLNTLLQARFSDAGTVLTRFLLNTTGGIAGFGDPAATMGFAPLEATFCQTLANWGVEDGIYLVIPVMGPSTLRDAAGITVDRFAVTPYYFWAAGWEEATGIYIGKEVNNLSLHLGEYEKMKDVSFDPYVAVRDGYFQHREQMWGASASE